MFKSAWRVAQLQIWSFCRALWRRLSSPYMNIGIRLVWRRVLDWNRRSHLAWQLPPWSRKLWFYLCKVSWYWLWRNEMEEDYSQNPSLQAWTLQSICMNKCTMLVKVVFKLRLVFLESCFHLMQSSICWLFGCKYSNLCNFESVSVQLLESMMASLW